ncbi:MAG TPA: type II toxin-antitoxin system RelE/ParE family toxin [Cyclobacteriaceae bacterium]
MAKKIVWTETAIKDRYRIYLFWEQNNFSNTYSKKLERIFQESAILISTYPEIGRPTDLPGIRIKVIRGYAIFYKSAQDSVEILRIWDTRQDPNELKIN